MDKALATQLANIEKRTGKPLAALAGIVKASGLTKHGEIRDMLKKDLGMGHGDANTLVHHVLQSDGASAAEAAGRSERRRRRRHLHRAEAGAAADPRPVHGRDRAVRPVRGCAEKGLCEPAPQEAVRDDRSGHQQPCRGRAEHEGCARHRAPGRPGPRAGCARYKVKLRTPATWTPSCWPGSAAPSTAPADPQDGA